MKKSGVIKAVITILIILLIVGAYYFLRHRDGHRWKIRWS